MKVRVDENLSLGWRVFKKNPPTLSVTMIVKGVFSIKPGMTEFWPENEFTVNGDIYLDDDPTKSLRYESDFAPFKPRADLLLVGSAWAPAGIPLPSLLVRWRVGAFEKTLRVTGNRSWSRSLLGNVKITEPEPFLRMPLAYEHAFGGPRSKKNPVGRGYHSETAPNIEDLDRPAAGPHDGADPAGFGPLAISWAQRASHGGTYDDKYLKERWPWFPADFDWGFYNAAPRDQQIEGFLRGDEVLELENLHPEHPVYRSRLPGRRARWILKEKLKDGTLRFREVPLRLDTLWIDMDAEQLVLVWRGLVEVQSVRLKEIEQMLVVTEPLAEPARTLDHYQEELKRRLAKEDEDDPEEQQLMAEEAKKLEEISKEQDQLKAELGVELRVDEPAKQAEGAAEPPPEGGGPMAELAASLATEIASLKQRGVKHDDPALVEAEAKLAQLEQMRRENPDEVPLTREGVMAAARQGESFAGRNLSNLDLSDLNLSGLDFSEALLHKTKLARSSLAKANLSGAVLFGADLTETSLAEAALDDAILLEAQVVKVKFVGASLSGTDLSKLNLDGADFSSCSGKGTDFSEAKLAGARFAGVKLPQATFSGSSLERANFAGAELQGAQLDGVNARQVNMEGADLTGLQAGAQSDFTGGNFRKVKADGSVWEQCVLDEADFSGSLLRRAQLSEASLRKTRCERADLTGANFSDACLAQAVMTSANLLRASFDRADLTRADFREANMYEAGFWEAVTDKADFRGANLKNTLLG